MLYAFLSLLAAFGADTGLHLGLDAGVNDPFLKKRGLSLGTGIEPWSVTGFWLSGHYVPDLGEADWRYITTQLVNEAGISPDISRIRWRLDGTIRLSPLQVRAGDRLARVGFHAGLAAIKTEDDAEALQVDEDDEYFAATSEQVHPASVWGFSGDVRGSRTGLWLGVERTSYIETLNSGTLESKGDLWIFARGMLWL